MMLSSISIQQRLRDWKRPVQDGLSSTVVSQGPVWRFSRSADIVLLHFRHYRGLVTMVVITTTSVADNTG